MACVDDPFPSSAERVRARSRARHGGRLGTAGAAPVALSFDHGLAKFRDLLLPQLRRLGLPATIAVCTDDIGRGENVGVTYRELESWAVNYGLEVANHARSHADWRDSRSLQRAILEDGLYVLRANLPSVSVDAFIQPGVQGEGSWMGWNNGDAAAKYRDHTVGRWILDHHAVATGTIAGRSHAVSGEPVQGAGRIAFDVPLWADVIRASVADLEEAGRGMLIYCHPNLIDTEGHISLAEVTQLLEFLAAQRDQHAIEVLTVSGFAWSDPGTDARADLARLAGGFREGVMRVDIASAAPWARGGQWLLEATGAGTISAQVADDAGLLRTSWSASGRVRVVFTIPAGATTITCSVSPHISSARVVPV